jgi:maleylpyruvate isomerase
VTDRLPWDTLVGWADDGQEQVYDAAAALGPADVHGASRLAGWSRGHVLSHLARNADALVNLLDWARTGAESRMYSSPTERADGIDEGADRELPEQLADLAAANARFLQAASSVEPVRRSFTVLSGQGREIPAHEVPWLRVRETWLHHVDHDAGYDIDALPDAVAWALTADVAGWMSSRTQATADLASKFGTIRLGPGSVATVIEGSPQRIAGWLTGRSGTSGLTSADVIPELPPWL